MHFLDRNMNLCRTYSHSQTVLSKVYVFGMTHCEAWSFKMRSIVRVSKSDKANLSLI